MKTITLNEAIKKLHTEPHLCFRYVYPAPDRPECFEVATVQRNKVKFDFFKLPTEKETFYLTHELNTL